jgi:hypothetical protein
MKPSIKRITISLALAMPVCLTNSALAAETTVDVSQIISKTEAESILGEKVNDPTPRNAQGKDGYYSKCNYYTVSHRKSLVIRVYQPSGGAPSPKEEIESVAASTGPMKSVDGLGDKAETFSRAGDGGAYSGVFILYIAKGNSLVTIGLGGMDDDNIALTRAKEIADKILAKL